MIVSVPNNDKNRSGKFKQYTILSSLYRVCRIRINVCHSLLAGQYNCADLELCQTLPTFMNCCLFCFTFQSTAMVIAGGSIHLTPFFSWVSLKKRLTSTVYILCLQPTTTLLE